MFIGTTVSQINGNYCVILIGTENFPIKNVTTALMIMLMGTTILT